MILRIFGHDFHYECENLCRVYFPNEKINIVYDESGEDERTVITKCSPIDGGNLVSVDAEIDGVSRSAQAEVIAEDNELRDRSELKTAQLIFSLLSEITGYTPPWGVLTGVRPSKLMLRLIDQMGAEGAKRYFTEDLLVSEEKTMLAQTVANAEEKIIALSDELSNIRAIYRDYNKLGDELWNRFNQKDKKEHAWYYGSFIETLAEYKGSAAYEEYCELVNKIFG